MKYANFHYHKYPVVIVEFTGEPSTDENFKEYLEELSDLYTKNAAFSLIFDATNASLPGFRHQKMQADWLKKMEDMMKEYCLKTAYIIPNSVVRTILKSIFKLQKQPVPYKVVRDMKEAMIFVNDLEPSKPLNI